MNFDGDFISGCAKFGGAKQIIWKTFALPEKSFITFRFTMASHVIRLTNVLHCE